MRVSNSPRSYRTSAAAATIWGLRRCSILGRGRPGGRVEAVTLPDGRIVQAGGEVFGYGHEAYRELVAELGMEVQPSYVADPGEMTWGLVDGVLIGDQPPWMSDLELADLAR